MALGIWVPVFKACAASSSRVSNPAKLVKAFLGLIHEEKSAQEAWEIYAG